MRTRRRIDTRRVSAQAGLFLVCCALALGTHCLIAADVLDDRCELAVDVTGFLGLVGLAVASVCGTRRAEGRGAYAALAALALGCLAVAATFTWSSYPDASIALADLVAPAAAADATGSLVVGPDGRDVRLSGDIGEGAADRLEALLAGHPAITRIHLTSEGGLADEGQALGNVIAAHHLTTYVPDFCVSACTLAFVAGEKRLMMEGARLGFHEPFYEGVLGQSFAGDASAQRAAYLHAGLTAAFVDRALEVAPDDAWFPTSAELLSAHVVSGVVGRAALPDSMLDGASTRQGALAVVLRNFPALQAVQRVAPQQVEAIADRYFDGYRHGYSEARDTDELKRAVRRAFGVALLRAEDATLLDVARYLSRAMRSVAASQPTACAAIGDGIDLLGAETVLEATDVRADAIANDLVAGALKSPYGAVSDAPRAAFRSVALTSTPTCATMRALYERVLDRRDPSPLRFRLAAASRQ